MNLLDKFHSLHSTKIEKTFIGLGTWEKLHLLAERESVFVCVCDRERGMDWVWGREGETLYAKHFGK